MENVRRLVERNRQDTGLAGARVAARPVRSVGIFGAGTMGTAVAAAHLKFGVDVAITDSDPGALFRAPERIAVELAGDVPHAEARRLVEKHLQPTSDEAAVAGCDLVFETIIESFVAKRSLYGRLKGHLRPDAVVTSNTSTIPIGRLAAELADPARVCGFHFCHPVRLRPLVEVVRGAATSDPTVATVVAHAKAIRRMPVVVADGPGFLVNRLLLPYLDEALSLLTEGVSIEAVERVAGDFGFAKGPFRLLDEIGLDTTLQAAWVLAEAFPDRIASSPILVGLVKAGRLGQKSGAGFFGYSEGEQGDVAGEGVDETTGGKPCRRPVPPVDPFVAELVARWVGDHHEHTPLMITARLLLPMVLEATRLLEENKVRDPRDVDLAVVFGLGFPESKGGLLWWADTLGPARIIEMLRPMRRLGKRVRPTPMLEAMARSHRRFYQGRSA
jgi:3-hydroxyacyl-CoA dehydrogenase